MFFHKIRRKLNRKLWHYFGLSIQIKRGMKKHEPFEDSMVIAIDCFGDTWHRCVYKEGKFRSINDGKEIEFVAAFIQI